MSEQGLDFEVDGALIPEILKRLEALHPNIKYDARVESTGELVANLLCFSRNRLITYLQKLVAETGPFEVRIRPSSQRRNWEKESSEYSRVYSIENNKNKR